METGCSLRQSNILIGGEDTSCGLLGNGNISLAHRSRSFRFRPLGSGNYLGGIGVKKNLRVMIACKGYDHSVRRFIEESGRRFHNSYQKRSSMFKVDDVFHLSRTGRLCCQGNDLLEFVDENGKEDIGYGAENAALGSMDFSQSGDATGGKGEGDDSEGPSLKDLRDILQKALKELEVARMNSLVFEEKAQRISEMAIALKDQAQQALNDIDNALVAVQQVVNEEAVAKEAFQKATMALSIAEATRQAALESLEVAKREKNSLISEETDQEIMTREKDNTLLIIEEGLKDCQSNLVACEAEWKRLLSKKDESEREVIRLKEIAEKAQNNALKAEEDVANIMVLAEQAVALELEALQWVNDAEIALKKAEKSIGSTLEKPMAEENVYEDDSILQGDENHASYDREIEIMMGGDHMAGGHLFLDKQSDRVINVPEVQIQPGNLDVQDMGKLAVDANLETEVEAEKLISKKQDTLDTKKESSPFGAPKALLKKSSRFFSASFFSFTGDGEEFTQASAFQGTLQQVKEQWPKLILGALLFTAGITFMAKRVDRSDLLIQQHEAITVSTEEVSSLPNFLVRKLKKLPKRIKKLASMIPQQEVNEEEASLLDMLWLLLASVAFVPVFQKIPGGSPVLGYLAAGILIGPYGLSIIRHVHGTKAIAEFGVVFLLFNIGLELSVERLSSMKKYVFGLGTAQVLVTAVVVGLVAHFVCGQSGPAAIVIGNGLALSSTAVVLQVLQERGESTSRHGRATFSVLLFQDLAVVVLLILIPLISPNSSKGGVGLQAIVEALGLSALKAAVAISVIIAGGRLLLRPIYKQIAENQNAEIFSANTLLVVLGTSLLTARAGLSMALGAFLAGLLLAETEFSLQVESDIAPYRGLLLGLFFMTVGMSIDPKLLVSNFPVISGTLALLIGGKTILVALIGRAFGISIISAIRVGFLLAPGGEFAFVAFGEAVNQAIMPPQLSSLLFLVVGISMALTPWLAAGGQLIASHFEQQDVRSLLPVESETDDLHDHIIICGFGRVGQIIAQLLSERLIPFVALDIRSDRVAVGRALDLPVYFGDAGSREVLHKVGADRACAAAITLDSPGANYRTVWALNKYFPNVKTFVRAHDVDHGINLEKAGATAVVPETLEPSLQLAAAVLAQAKLPMSEIAATINEFRSRYLSELTEFCLSSGNH
ncbi:hypothetical protein MLD38_018289 [Melastoma candidum]|uniref:Uncharacterized protein n=1 Tax=Melastoma candidum TaxID=119954 RepID=A0ACB9QTF4_9MYRT|nr:hypothetical protein MLD38_018289 [Melastoma candidum]